MGSFMGPFSGNFRRHAWTAAWTGRDVDHSVVLCYALGLLMGKWQQRRKL